MSRHSWRYPPRPWRIFLVAMVYVVVGLLAGGIVGVLLGGFLLGSLIGAIAGAVTGASMEGRSNTRVADEARTADDRDHSHSQASSNVQSSMKPRTKE